MDVGWSRIWMDLEESRIWMFNNSPMPTIASTWDRYGLNIVPKYEFPWFYHLDPVDPLFKILMLCIAL